MRVSARLTARRGSLIERSPSGGPMVMAGLVGLITGLASVGFEELIEVVHSDVRLAAGGRACSWGNWRVFIAHRSA